MMFGLIFWTSKDNFKDKMVVFNLLSCRLGTVINDIRHFMTNSHSTNIAPINGPKGFVLAAPHSGSGKTTLSIGLMRALRRRGIDISPAKVGPDYIDPQFHEVASGVPSYNLDGWAMGPETLSSLGEEMMAHGSLCVIEGVMGLFDGAVKPGVLGHGATCEIAKFFKLPVILVVDCAGMGQSVAALVKGFAEFDKDVQIAGVILNKLGSLRHVTMMEQALLEIGMPVVGAIPRYEEMVLPSRHLGLVQATESSETNSQIDKIADHVEAHISVDRILDLAGQFRAGSELPNAGLAPLGQHIAVAEDDAFRFFYPHLKRGWQEAQASLSFFSPLNNEAPDASADAIYLPGGYPELYAGRLAASATFLNGVRKAAGDGKVIYGECGGYMSLGRGLVDKDGDRHQMLDLLPLETSFAKRKLHLGYRHVKRDDGQIFRGHEFHYASILKEEGRALFKDVEGSTSYGLRQGVVSGSFVHLIDAA